MNLRPARPRGKASLTLLVALCVIAGAVVATMRITAPSGPELVFPGDGSESGAMTPVRAQKHRSAYVGSACVNKPGQIDISSIEPVEPRGGIEVTDFSVVSPPDDGAGILGVSNKRLRDEPSFRGGNSVTATCASDGYVDVFVEVYKPGSADATARGFTITYDSDGDRRTVPLRFGLSLCDHDDCDAE